MTKPSPKQITEAGDLLDRALVLDAQVAAIDELPWAARPARATKAMRELIEIVTILVARTDPKIGKKENKQ